MSQPPARKRPASNLKLRANALKGARDSLPARHESNEQIAVQDKVVFITGGTSGIGLAAAAPFASEGAAHVIVCGRRQSKWVDAQKYLKL